MNTPNNSVRVVVLDEQDPSHFLVLAEADDPDNWKHPGGKYDADELPEDAAGRELEEELGIHDARLVEADELLNDDGVSKRHIFFVLMNRELPKPTSEVAATQWVTEDTIPDSPNKGHILSALKAARAALEASKNS